VDVAELLVTRGEAPLDVGNEYTGMTPLHWAAADGDVAMVRLLLHHGANIEAKSAVRTTEQPRGSGGLRLGGWALEPGRRGGWGRCCMWVRSSELAVGVRVRTVLPLSDVIRDSAVQLVLTRRRGAVGVDSSTWCSWC
jgi:ankyrin repeat protein